MKDSSENLKPIKKRLCLLIPTLQAGGMERVMSELSGYFCKQRNLQVHIVLFGKEPELFYPLPECLHLHMPSKKFNNKLRTFYTVSRMLFVRGTVSKLNPDSILSFGEYWNSFVLFSLIKLPYPVYISDRCSPVKKYTMIHTILRKILYPKASGMIAQTEIAKELYYKTFRHSNIIVIGNPVRRIFHGQIIERENIVLMVGRLIYSKHQDKLIEVFLNINLPGWKLIIVGHDHLRQNNYERLCDLIHKNNAESKVFLTGKRSDVDYFYLRSKIFAFTSSSEGFPNVLCEAMSAGLPVIAFDCIAGPSDIISNNNNGFLIPLFDWGQFEEKLRLLMTNEELRSKFGKFSLHASKKYDLNRIGEQYLDFIINPKNKII